MNLNNCGIVLNRVYLAGLDLNVSVLFPPIEYPVSRGTAGLAELVHWEHSETWRTGLEDKMNNLVSVKDIQVTLNSEEFRDLVGHQLDDRIIIPTSSYLVKHLKSSNLLYMYLQKGFYILDDHYKDFKY